jgi:hypothetical protein
MTQVNGASMGNCRNVLASIVLTAALFAPPGIGSAQEQVAPTRDVMRSKVIRTRRSPDAFLAGWVSRPEPDRFWLRFGYLERIL